MTKATLSVIIPAWNQWDMTRACLKSLAAHPPPEVDFTVILVDNGSTDATPAEAPTLGNSLFQSRFLYLPQDKNLGFAAACNLGARAVDARYLFFLNNDTEVAPGWFPPLLKALREDARLAGAGPLLLFPEDDSVNAGRVQHLGIATAMGPDFRHLYELFPASHPVAKQQRKWGVITAAALLLRGAQFKAEQGFHQGFVNGMEDVDLCCRMARRGGYFSVIPESVVHHHGHTTPGRFDHESDNQILLHKRCRDAREDWTALITEDGYEPAFTPWLDLVARLPRTRDRELAEQYLKNPDIGRLVAMLEEEPLWERGYATVIHRLLGVGRAQEALSFAYLRTLLCPAMDGLTECLQLARRCGHQTMIQHYAKLIGHLETALADKNALAERAGLIARKAPNKAVEQALREVVGEASGGLRNLLKKVP